MIAQYNVFVDEQYNAIRKAEDDVNAIWKEMGIENSVNHHRNRIIFCLERIIRLSCSNAIFVQYPAYSEKILKIVCRVSKKKKPIYAFVHDLRSVREKAMPIETEVNMLKRFDGLIVLTRPMKMLLEKYGYTGKMSCLNMWDYLQNSDVMVQNTENKPCVCFAGNLNKSPFIRQLGNIQTKFLVYGDRTNAFKANNVIFKGMFTPDVLPTILDGNWGLVWDGESLCGCRGDYGEYLRYNIPHKTALYLAAGKPIITWCGAAIAEYIVSNGIGFCVDSLLQLDDLLSSIDDSTYLRYKTNVMKLREEIISGHNIRNATEEIMVRD